MTKVALITATPRVAATGATATVRLAGGGSRKAYYYQGQHWRAGVASLPRFSASIGYDDNGWTGGVVPTSSAITFAPASKAHLAELAAYFWRGAAITIQEGEEDTEVFTTRLTGTVADATIADHRLTITVADLSQALDKPVLTARFAGTGGAEGGTEAKERIKRRTWGRAFNIEGRVLDKANNIYEFGDLSYPWQSFDAVRDMGRDASPAPTVVAWAGSIAATLTALIAATPAQGSGAVAPSIACVKWWTQPVGPLTADVHGEIGTSYVETAPAIAERIMTAMSGPTITNTAAAIAMRGGVAGLHVDEGETIASALDRLMLGVSLLWILNPAGTITLREFTFTGPVETLIADDVQRVRTLPPVKTRRLGYQRSHRLHSDGEIAAVLLAADTQYADGTTIEALKPAEAGANVTATHTAAAIVGQGALATKSVADFAADVTGSTKPFAYAGQVLDTRAANDAPSAYYALGMGVRDEFKNANFAGSGSAGFGALRTVIQYPDITGGPVKQTLLDSTGQIFERQSADAATWGAWMRNYNAAYKPVFGADLREDASTLATLANFKTGLGTAAAITGQGSGATANNLTGLNPTEGSKLGGITPFAGVGDNLLFNSAFANGGEGWTVVRGTFVPAGATTDPAPFILSVSAAGGGDASIQSSYRPLPNLNGGRLSLSIWLYRTAGQQIAFDLLFLNAANAFVQQIRINDFGNTPVGVWTQTKMLFTGINANAAQVSLTVTSVGANSLFLCSPHLSTNEIGSTLGSRAGTNLFRSDGSTVMTQAEVRTPEGTAGAIAGQGWFATENALDLEDATRLTNRGRITRLTIDGRAVNGKTLNSNNNFGLRSLNDPPALSVTDMTGSCRINIGSGIMYGDWGSSYTFPSGSITGLAYATTYYVWRNQAAPDTIGESWGYSTSLLDALAPGKVYMGRVETPASAGAPVPPPPPPPGDGNCVASDAWVETRDRGFVRAREIVAGDWLRLLSPDREDTMWGECEGNHLARSPGVRLRTISGVSLALSASTPITLRDGSICWAPHAAAHELPVYVDRLTWERCTVEPLGEIEVAHIRCRQGTYAAGDEAGRSILTHNPINKP